MNESETRAEYIIERVLYAKLTLLIAESNPKKKDQMAALVTQMLK